MERLFASFARCKNPEPLSEELEDMLFKASLSSRLMDMVETLNGIKQDDLMQISPEAFDRILQALIDAHNFISPLAIASAVHVLVNVAGAKISESCLEAAVLKLARHAEQESMAEVIGAVKERWSSCVSTKECDVQCAVCRVSTKTGDR